MLYLSASHTGADVAEALLEDDEELGQFMIHIATHLDDIGTAGEYMTGGDAELVARQFEKYAAQLRDLDQ